MKVLGKEENFLGIEEQYSTFDASRIVILSAPYEATVSYGKGTGMGPTSMLEASHYVELWDQEFGQELCFDAGIATLPPLDFGELTGREMLAALESQVAALLDLDKFVVTLGGEHSISPAPVAAHYRKYPNMSVLQIDAHSDLRAEYEGNPWSHASAMARVIDFFPPERLVQVGIRAQCKEEYDTIQLRGIQTFFGNDIRQGRYGASWPEKVFDALGDEVYITFDVDGLDPSVLPATGTPEPGGLFWDETIQLMKIIGSEKRIVGFDVVELAPTPEATYSSFVAAKLVYKMLNAAFIKARKG